MTALRTLLASGPLGLLALLPALLLTWAPGTARAQVPEFAVVFHVATTAAGVPVVDDDTLRTKLAEAGVLFAPAGVAFYIDEVRSLPPEHEVIDDIRERRHLRRYLVPRAINIFVTQAIHDPRPSAATVRAAAAQGREPTGWISGAHIPSGGRQRPATYILLSARTGLWSLPHELGHFFGANHHPDPDNVMSYGFGRRVFDERQLALFRRRAASYVRRRDVRSRDTSVHAVPEG
ncbi:MAG: hypothetical protein KC668_05370 [Myxococcales bacterium]|nr:hypothetical protein [Myxococcales bacterium]